MRDVFLAKKKNAGMHIVRMPAPKGLGPCYGFGKNFN